MTTASIKPTEQLAKESTSRKSSGVAEIKPTAAVPAISEDSGEKLSPPANTEKRDNDLNEQKPCAPKIEPISMDQLDSITQLMAKLSFKNTGKLNALRNEVNQAKRGAVAAGEKVQSAWNQLNEQTLELVAKNEAHQEELKESSVKLLETLKSLLDAGKSQEALPTWDKIQGNISNSSGKIKQELQKRAAEHKDALTELRNWRTFAATEKKKQLIEQMSHLIESKMHASDRSKHISSMHKEWKLLGHSNQNEELWKEFKTLSDKAYEPCKDYFKQKKTLMAENLKQRKAICELLEEQLQELNSAPINISQISKLITKSEENWKKFAPVEQAKIKTLQKQYYSLINQLRKLRRNSTKGNAKAKQDCIQEAVKLSELDDNAKAMSEAKALQRAWKEIGPTTFKEDKVYWDKFRKACDKIFEKKNNATAALKEELSTLERSLKATLDSLEEVFLFDDESLRAKKGEYQALLQKFSNDLDPRLKAQRKALTERFNSIKRKVDMRYKSLPDKRLLKLQEKIRSKASVIEQLESNIKAASNEDGIAKAIAQFNSEEWNAFAAIEKDSLDDVLENRLQAICSVKTPVEFSTLEQSSSQEIRKLCIELEIRANIESPSSDQSERMAIQLAQLQSGFGKSKPDRKENSDFAASSELLLSCSGPKTAEDLSPILDRIKAARDRLR